MATIRIKREEALNLLREAEESSRKNQWQTPIIEYGDALAAEMDVAAPYAERVEAWYRAMADGVADGTITFTKGGAPKNAPPKPQKNGAEIARTAAHGRRHYGVRDEAYHFDECKNADEVRQVVENLKEQRESALAPIKAQITLFSLSADEVIEVDQGNFHGLLSGRRYL